MNNLRSLPSLLVFAEVAKRKSFTEAARHLKMSKSAASQHIRRLETETGHQLLSRNTRGMSLTAAGARLLVRSELLKDQVDLAFLELSETDETPNGPFSVTFPHSFAPSIVTPAIRQLCAEFPDIKPQLIATDEPLDLIKEGLDVALYAGNLRDSGYRALPIGTLTECFCASPAYLQKHGMPKTIKALQGHRWIAAHWQKSPLTLHSKSNPDEKITVTLEPFARCNSFASVLDLAQEDIGMVFLPQIARQPLVQQGRLIPLLTEYQGQKWPIYFVHPYQRKKPLHVERFYQLAKHFFRKASDVT